MGHASQKSAVNLIRIVGAVSYGGIDNVCVCLWRAVPVVKWQIYLIHAEFPEFGAEGDFTVRIIPE